MLDDEDDEEEPAANPWDTLYEQADAVGEAVLLIRSISRKADADRVSHLWLGHINHQPPPAERDERGRKVSAVAQWAEVQRRAKLLTMSVVELLGACPHLQTLDMPGGHVYSLFVVLFSSSFCRLA
jgi:hypothetical protein